MKVGGTSTQRVIDIPLGATSNKKLRSWMETTCMSTNTFLSLATNGVNVTVAMDEYCPWIDVKSGFIPKFTFPNALASPSTSGAAAAAARPRVGDLDLDLAGGFLLEDFLALGGMVACSSSSSSSSSSLLSSSSVEVSSSSSSSSKLDPSDAKGSESERRRRQEGGEDWRSAVS